MTRAIAKRPTLATRLICGAIAGFVATAPMTSFMRRRHKRLDGIERYPLPPREIVGSLLPEAAERPATDLTLAAHFAYGALSGAAIAAIAGRPTIGNGVAGGLAVWLGSYMGWVPSFGILKPATRHPGSRNRLMTLAHIVWGAAFAITQAELEKSRDAIAAGPLKDQPA